MHTEKLYRLFLDSSGVCTDSRRAREGQIFFSVKGERFNGNKFAGQAIEAGCRYAVVDEDNYAVNESFIKVEDALRSLQEIAGIHRKRFEIPLIAITGSNGKTTTKELAAAVLSQKYKIHATSGNLNNHVGLPLTLLDLDSSHEMAVLEIGANHPGEVDLLCRLSRPTHGLITNIGAAHLEGFGSLEGVKRAKSELYAYLCENGGTGFVNAENDILSDLHERYPFNAVFYGTGEDHFMCGRIKDFAPFLTMVISGRSVSGKEVVHTRLTGRYNSENITAAACIGRNFGVSQDLVKEALEMYTPRNNRSQITETASNRLFLDSYNANPVSMKLAINEFAGMEGGRKWLILGDMLELGNYSREEHIAILELLKELSFNNVLLVGENFMLHKDLYPFKFFKTTAELNLWLRTNKPENAFILVKGSRGIRLEDSVPLL